MEKYSEKTIIAFLKALAKNNVIKGGAWKNKEVVKSVNQIVSATDEEFENEIPHTASTILFRDEFSDWIETYKEVE